jgi:microcystin-dependent protein
MEPYVGEIRMFAGAYAPQGWMFCDGQTLAVAQHQELFSLVGVRYGGNGTTTFGLPDLRGRWPVDATPSMPVGRLGGADVVALGLPHLPSHHHEVLGSAAAATSTSPSGVWAATTEPGYAPGPVGPGALAMAPDALGPAGGSEPHDNLPPYLTVRFMIAVSGRYPERS